MSGGAAKAFGINVMNLHVTPACLPMYGFFFSPPPSQCQLQWRSAQEVSHCLHPPAGSGAGEGVPLQPVPDPAQAGGDRAHDVPVRAPGQDLVSEPEDEVEEGAQASQHEDPLLQLGLVFSLWGPAAADQNRPTACPHAVHCRSIVHKLTPQSPIKKKNIQPRLRWQTTQVEFDGPIFSILHTWCYLCHLASAIGLLSRPLYPFPSAFVLFI